MSNVVETTISKEKKRREGGVNVWRRGFGGSWGLVGVDSRPWVKGASGCDRFAGVTVCGREIEGPC